MADNCKPRHLLITADTVGGVWTYSIELARAVAWHGVQVSLATMGRAIAEWQREEAHAVPGLKLYESTFPLEWQDNPWEGVDEASTWLLELDARLRPDIVHVNGYSHAAIAWSAPVVCVAHSCVCSWWRAVKGEAAPARYGEYRRRVRNALTAAGAVIAPSQAMLRALEQEYGYSRGGVCIPNGRSTASFSIGDKQPYILTSGRIWDEAKNIATLDAIAGSLSWPVYVAGDEAGPDGRSTRFAGLRPLGRLNTAEIAARFGEAAIYALPARYEPFGLSALEAALSGCALVLGDIPSLHEIWGDAALYVAPDDHKSVAETLERVIRSTALREDLATRARLRARRFSPERMALGYLEAYSRVRSTAATGKAA